MSAASVADIDEFGRGYEKARLDVYHADSLPELLKERQQLTWLVEHWLEAGTVALLVGAEGSFKSFVAIDWSLSIATGATWQGCRVSRGRVLYIAGEGRTGVIRRMRGWCDYHESVADEILLGRAPIQLINLEDADRIASLGKFELVVIDTLARNFGAGNENDQKDMSAAIENADRIKRATGATVLVVHHAPLEGREEGKLRPRGSSTLPGAADAIFTTSYDKDSKVITVASTKQKDAATPESMFLSFDVVDLGDQDNFGNPISTVVLTSTQKRPVSRKALAKNQRRLIQELRSRGRGKDEMLVVLRDVTDALDLSRQSRLRLEEWFREQPWSREAGGGYVVELEELPDA